MINTTQQRVVNKPLDRIDGPKKVNDTTTYTYEHSLDDMTYTFPVQNTIAKNRIVSIDANAIQTIPNVITILTHENAPRLKTQKNKLTILQSNTITYRGQFVTLIVAETLKIT